MGKNLREQYEKAQQIGKKDFFGKGALAREGDAGGPRPTFRPAGPTLRRMISLARLDRDILPAKVLELPFLARKREKTL